MFSFIAATVGLKLAPYVFIAHGLPATTYGYGEKMCGDIGKPRSCTVGAITASGEAFDPHVASAAIALPTKIRMSAKNIWIRTAKSACIRVRLNDKMNPRYIGKIGLDLSPAAVYNLTGKRNKTWSGIIFICKGK